ncbi:MAG: methyltransferase domain-containing protein, partial [Bacillota bacterium]|nr:methyltransferase domain-containing protein [Bacillota bacterium]
IEDIVEMSGIETLHPGGFALTKRTAEIAGLKEGMKVLDVSCGRGTQAIYYAEKFGVSVVGLDLSEEMIATAINNAKDSSATERISFVRGDSQDLPFDDNSFDVLINECAVGIPNDSQKVIDEMVRVAKPGGSIVIHESTWLKGLTDDEKEDIAERYGTTPLEYSQWKAMLTKAGVRNIVSELEEWSKPEMFWKVRKDRDVKDYSKVFTYAEQITTLKKIYSIYGLKGIKKGFENRELFYKAIIDGKLGYCLFKGEK